MFYAFKFVCCSPTDKFAIVTLPVCVYSVNAAAFVTFFTWFLACLTVCGRLVFSECCSELGISVSTYMWYKWLSRCQGKVCEFV